MNHRCIAGWAFSLFAALGLGMNQGCVAALGNRISVPPEAYARQAVVVEGRIYVVDVYSGEVMALREGAVQEAHGFRQIHIEEEEVD